MQLANQTGYQEIPGVTTGSETQQVMDNSAKRQDFGKAWVVGDKLSLFLPIIWRKYLQNGEPVMEQEVDQFGKPMVDPNTGEPVMVEKGKWEIIVYAPWGHDVSNMKELPIGTSFIPSMTEIYNKMPVKFLRDEQNNIKRGIDGSYLYDRVEGDIAYQFSKIAPLFIKGREQAEKDKQYNKQYDSEEMRRAAIAQIEEKYDTQKNMDAPKPIIGKIRLASITEVLAVPMDRHDEYVTEKAQFYIYKIGRDKLEEYSRLLADNKYRPRDHEQTWFEVQITFAGQRNDMRGRAEAGRKAHPMGLTPEFLMKNRSPEMWEKISHLIARVPRLSSTIAAHSYMATPVKESTIKNAIAKYVAYNGDQLDSISAEKDTEIMMGNAYNLVKFAALDTMQSEKLKAQIKEAYNEYLAEHPEAQPELHLATEAPDYKEVDIDKSPTVADLLQENPNLELPDEGADEYVLS